MLCTRWNCIRSRAEYVTVEPPGLVTSITTLSPPRPGHGLVGVSTSGTSMLVGDPLRWNTSAVTDMRDMFSGATAFDHDLGAWDVTNVADMRGMFGGATRFNQDLSAWCVPHIPTQPDGFDAFATSWTAPRPIWGTCAGVPEPRVISVTIDQGDQ